MGGGWVGESLRAQANVRRRDWMVSKHPLAHGPEPKSSANAIHLNLALHTALLTHAT